MESDHHLDYQPNIVVSSEKVRTIPGLQPKYWQRVTIINNDYT
jgi:hypothetical protein